MNSTASADSKFFPSIDPTRGRSWVLESIKTPTDDEIRRSRQFQARLEHGNQRELIEKSVRQRIIMVKWQNLPEHDNAADSIQQAIDLFDEVESEWTNLPKFTGEALAILGNPAKPFTIAPPGWERFKGSDGEGWKNQLISHWAYFFDNGAILVTRRRKGNIPVPESVEFQKSRKDTTLNTSVR